jgi:hypothetical protein
MVRPGENASHLFTLWGGGSLEPRTAIEGSFSAWGGLRKLDRRLGETFFPDSDSDRDSDETFQISQKLGLVNVEFFCLLDSQLCLYPSAHEGFTKMVYWIENRKVCVQRRRFLGSLLEKSCFSRGC